MRAEAPSRDLSYLLPQAPANRPLYFFVDYSMSLRVDKEINILEMAIKNPAGNAGFLSRF
jgi:hypothetical protein